MLDFLKNSSKRTGSPVWAPENIVNFVLGMAILIILGLVVSNFFQNRNTKTASAPTPTQEQLAGRLGDASENANLPVDHTVRSGETLWSISEKYYSSGYNWVDIAKANSTVNPSQIEVGTKLTIPIPTEIKQPATTVASQGDFYTVVKGDTLWSISLKSYGDAYKWADIAKANTLTHPNLIHAGNVLKIPR